MNRFTRRHILRVAAILPVARLHGAVSKPKWYSKLEEIRVRHDIPALAAAVVSSRGLRDCAVTGVRKRGEDVAATVNDLWHLGSNTKAMTSTLAAIAVEARKIRWDSTLAEIFPKVENIGKSTLGGATLTHLLSHWSGLPANPNWREIARRGGDVRLQRGAALAMALVLSDLPMPGKKHLYSNWGYVLAGHMLEETIGQTWEELMRRAIFARLGIPKAGFGGTGTPGKIDQPWPHGSDGKPMPRNGPAVDNPPALGPAGTVHMSLADWSVFIAEHLAGRKGRGKLLKEKTYKYLHTATQAGNPYAYGWADIERPWGGRVLNHNGSNTMNFSVAWVAPDKDFAMIACTNQGGDVPAKALDEVASLLVQEYT